MAVFLTSLFKDQSSLLLLIASPDPVSALEYTRAVKFALARVTAKRVITGLLCVCFPEARDRDVCEVVSYPSNSIPSKRK